MAVLQLYGYKVDVRRRTRAGKLRVFGKKGIGYDLGLNMQALIRNDDPAEGLFSQHRFLQKFMLRLTFEKFQVEVFDDHTFTHHSPDHAGRNSYLYGSPELEQYRPSAVYGIKIWEGDSLFRSAIVAGTGGGTAVNSRSVIIDRDRLLLCCGDHVFCLDLPGLHLMWKIKADPFTCIQIFCLPEGYIVHGEIQVSKLGRQGEMIWEAGGADIFVSMKGSNECVLHDGYIELTDFMENTYHIDYNGELLYYSGQK